MNALDIRVAHAKAEISILAGADQGFDALQGALDDAFSLGIRQFDAGQEETPMLFIGAPDLHESWLSGQDFAYQCEQTRRCELCREAQGDPCMIHG